MKYSRDFYGVITVSDGRFTITRRHMTKARAIAQFRAYRELQIRGIVNEQTGDLVLPEHADRDPFAFNQPCWKGAL